MKIFVMLLIAMNFNVAFGESTLGGACSRSCTGISHTNGGTGVTFTGSCTGTYVQNGNNLVCECKQCIASGNAGVNPNANLQDKELANRPRFNPSGNNEDNLKRGKDTTNPTNKRERIAVKF